MFKIGQLVRGNKSGSLFLVLSSDEMSARLGFRSGKYAGATARVRQSDFRWYTLIGNNYRAKR